MKKIDWIYFRVGRITLILIVFFIFFLFFYLPEKYNQISIILIMYVIFFLFLSIIILRQKIKINFPDKSHRGNSYKSGGDFENKNTPKNDFHPHLQKKMYNGEYFIINQRLLYPFLDIICGAIAFMIASVLFLINILNIIPIITLIILYLVIIDKIPNKSKSNNGDHSEV